MKQIPLPYNYFNTKLFNFYTLEQLRDEGLMYNTLNWSEVLIRNKIV